MTLGVVGAAWVENVAAERVDICNYQTFQQASGTHCNFSTAPGEWIHVWARYRDNQPGAAYVNLQPFTNVLNLSANQQGTMVKKIGVQNIVNANVYYSIGGFSPTGDYLDLDVWRERCNLRANAPSINSSTGEMRIPWAVTTQTPVSTNGYVYVEAWTGSSATGGSEAINRQWGLAPCINQGNCSYTQVVPLAERVPIPLGHSWLKTKIDPSFAHAETNEADNISSVYLDDFFSETIPTIMRARGANWEIPATLMDDWFEGEQDQKNSSIDSFDYSLQIIRVPGINTLWVLDPANSYGTAIQSEFGWLTTHYTTTAAKAALRARLNTKFSNNPGATSFPLSFNWNPGNLENYHRQHIQNRAAQESSYGSDPVTAALGAFSLYLVPFGTAVKNPNTYSVTITSIAVHVRREVVTTMYLLHP